MTSHSCQIKFHSNCWFHKYDPIGPHFSSQSARSLFVSRSFISSSSNFEDTSSKEEGETRQWQAVRWIYDWKQWNIQRGVVKEKRRRNFSRNSSRSSRIHISRREAKNGREKRSRDQNLIKKRVRNIHQPHENFSVFRTHSLHTYSTLFCWVETRTVCCVEFTKNLSEPTTFWRWERTKHV